MRKIFFTAAFTVILAGVLADGRAVFDGMGIAVEVCLDTMIPSLYAMMILSRIFVTCGFHNTLGKLLKVPAKYIFRCDGGLLAVFLFSQAAGYPVGSSMLLEMNRERQLSPVQAGFLSGVCFGCGPVFVSSLFAGNRADALAVTAAYMLSNLILFAVFVRFIKFTPSEIAFHNVKKSIPEIITSASAEGGAALLRICAVIVMFGGFTGLISDIPFLREKAGTKAVQVLFSFLEISHVTELFPHTRLALPLIGAAVSFGGICVLMQTAALTQGRTDIFCLGLTRLLSAFLTWGFLTLYEMIVPERSHAAAVILTAENASRSHLPPVSSLLLIAMTFMLLLTAEKNRRTI